MNFLSHDELIGKERRTNQGVPTSDIGWVPVASYPVYGYMSSEPQKEFFYWLGYHTRGNAVELGTCRGLSAVLAGLGMKHSPWPAKLWCVDTFEPFCDSKTSTLPEFLDNRSKHGLDDVIEPLIGSSAAMATSVSGPIEWLYVDAAHTCEAVVEDCLLYAPKVKADGLVVFHDVDQSAVRAGIEAVSAQLPIKHVFTRDDFEVWIKVS